MRLIHCATACGLLVTVVLATACDSNAVKANFTVTPDGCSPPGGDDAGSDATEPSVGVAANSSVTVSVRDENNRDLAGHFSVTLTSPCQRVESGAQWVQGAVGELFMAAPTGSHCGLTVTSRFGDQTETCRFEPVPNATECCASESNTGDAQ